jgi:hypothetical protein
MRMSNVVWSADKGWHDGEEVSNASLRERFSPTDLANPYNAEARAASGTGLVGVTRGQADILSEAMLNALLETDQSQWSDYTEALDAFCAVATPAHLEVWREANGI